MSKPTRRKFIAGASVIPFALWLEGCGGGGGNGTDGGNGGNGTDGGNGEGNGQTGLVRYNARSPEGQAMLQVYADTVATMKNAIAEGDPTGWVFQWYTHGVGSDLSPSQAKAQEIARIYPSPSPDRDLAEEVWNTCQAHYPGDDENFFLPWHRMYVYFFETIIRQVSGNASFTLPYWNYSTPDPAARGVIPPEFGDPSNPLFVGKRNPGVNDGRPIQQGQPGDPLSLSSLAQCQYAPNGANQGFNQALDFGLHGNIHVLTGNGQNMGSVPWAAGDPIFWAHHCNIDRLWASWNAAGRQNLNTQSWLDKEFVFADAQGNRVVAKVSDFTSTAALGYSYDQLESAPSCPSQPRSLTATRLRAASQASVTLGSEAVRVKLGSLPQSREIIVSRDDQDKELHIVIKKLATEVQPEVLYHLYLGLPEGADDATREEHLVGTVNFFAAMHGEHAEEEIPEGLTERFLSFNCTEVARRLEEAGVLGTEPTLTILPVGEPAEEAQPVLGEITLVEQ